VEKLIAAKLSRLSEYLGYLKALKGSPLRVFKEDFKERGALERYLHLAIEVVIDIGNEIISARQLRRPDQYRDIPMILAESGVIPESLAVEVAKMIGFRNLLVHGYAALDLELEYRFLETRLHDFEDYMKHVADWLRALPDEESGAV